MRRGEALYHLQQSDLRDVVVVTAKGGRVRPHTARLRACGRQPVRWSPSM